MALSDKAGVCPCGTASSIGEEIHNIIKLPKKVKKDTYSNFHLVHISATNNPSWDNIAIVICLSRILGKLVSPVLRGKEAAMLPPYPTIEKVEKGAVTERVKFIAEILEWLYNLTPLDVFVFKFCTQLLITSSKYFCHQYQKARKNQKITLTSIGASMSPPH